MNKFFDTNYWMFRVIIPGTWCSVLGAVLFKIHNIRFFLEYFSGLKAATIFAGFGIGFGLFFHYLINYPRRRKRFREIEKEYGPIDYMLEICKKCEKNCKIQKTYDSLSHVYFPILNDDIPAGTRSIVYDFSSVHTMFFHIAFISAIIAVLNSGILVWQLFRNGQSPALISVLYSSFLVIACLILVRKNAIPEGFLIRMFETQTEWLKRNVSLLERRLCDPHKSVLNL